MMGLNENKIRKGRFYATDGVVFDKDHGFSEVLYRLKFIPLRVEFRADKHMFEFIGISPLFDEINVLNEAPDYFISIATKDGEIDKIGVKRSDEKI